MTVAWMGQDCEDYEIGGGDLVPKDFKLSDQQPGIFRSWLGAVGLLVGAAAAMIGWGGFFYFIYCGLARVFARIQ